MDEEDFVDRLMYVFKAPIITWPSFESDITQEMHATATLHRLAMTATALKIEEATDYEAMLYIMTASMVNPLSHSWVKIYGYLFGKFYPQNAQLNEGLEKPSEWELSRDLKQLKTWIYRKQKEHMKELGKAANSPKQKVVLQEKYEQLTLPITK